MHINKLLLRITRECENFFDYVVEYTTDEETQSTIRQFINRVEQLETIQILKQQVLEECVKAGNDLFAFYAEDAIDQRHTVDMDIECERLNDYLQFIMNNSLAPHSMDMEVIYEDKLLED